MILEGRVGAWGKGPTWIGIVLYFKLDGEISVHSSIYFILWVFLPVPKVHYYKKQL